MANLVSGGGAAGRREQERLAAAMAAAAQKAAREAQARAAAAAAVKSAGNAAMQGVQMGAALAGADSPAPVTLPKWTGLNRGLTLPKANLAPDLTGRYNGVGGRQLAGPGAPQLQKNARVDGLARGYGEKGPVLEFEREQERRQKREHLRTMGKLSLKSLQAAQRTAEKQAAELEQRLEKADRQAGALGFLEPGQAGPAKQTRDSLRTQLETVQQRRDALAQELQGKEYALLPLEDDWNRNSGYHSTANGKQVAYSPLDGRPQETGFRDVLYDYINGNPKAVELVDARDTISGNYSLGFDKNYLKQMTGEEVKTYNYLYARDGKEQAEEYLKAITSGLTRKQREEETARWAQRAEQEPVKSSVFSVLESPAKGLSYLGQLVDFAGDGKLDQNAGYNRYSYVNSAIRGKVSDIAEEKWGKPGSFLYQTGMSMGDFLLNTAITGGNQALSLAIMGTGAAADATVAAKDRGLEDWQAFTLGTVAGAAEVVTEKVSLETLLDKTSLGKNAVGYLVKNVLAEGSEEVGSDLINLTADLLVSQDKSEWDTAIRQYEAQGFSEQEAFQRALGDQAAEMGLDFLGGALSGGVMGGGAVLGNGIHHNVQNRNAGKRAQSSVNSAYDTLLKTGLFSDEAGQALLRANAEVKDSQAVDAEKRNRQMQKLTLPGKEKAALQAAEGSVVDGQRPAVQYSLTPYTEHQKENWANSKSIVIYENQAQFESFVKEAVQSKGTNGKKIYFGAIPSDLAERVKSDTGVDIDGYNCSISSYEIRKILKDHGNEVTEAPRGQRAIKMEDILSIPEIIQSPDSITKANTEYNGRPVIHFKKTINGKTTVVAYTSAKHLDLTVQTMYSSKKRGSLATLTDEQASVDTPIASSGTASLNSILNPAEKINYKAPRGVDAIEWGRRTRKAAQAKTELERSAAFYKVDSQTVETVSRLARDTGARVVFDGTLGSNVEGYYAEGYIHLNPLHQNAAARIFTHELTHHLESAGVYGKLERLVLSQLGDVEQAVGEKIREYARNGKRLDAQGARAELVAGYVSEKLFTDEAAVRRVANADLSLAGRIRSFLSRLAAQVTGQKEKAFLLKAESLYAKAIREAGRKNDAAGNRFSVENGKGLWYDGEKGGVEDGGAEIRDAGGRDRGEVPGAGGQGTAGDGYFRGTESSSTKTQIGRGQNPYVRFTDSEGRRIRLEIAERLRGTAITDDAGNPVAVYHSTREKFTTFAKGDVGFHFGSLAQAESRARQKGGDTPSRTIRAYLNIQNTIHVSSDIMSWKPEGTALKLYTSGIILEPEFNSVDALFNQGQDYDSPASVKLREILKSKGYDGITYENGHEGEGTSYIAFYPEQIVQDMDGRKKFSLSREANPVKDVKHGLELRRPADVRKLTLPGNEKAAGEAAEGSVSDGQRPAAQYSIAKLPNGEKYVDVDTDQHRFDGLTASEMQKEARNIILEKFRNKVIGETITAYVNRNTAEEYSHPAKILKDSAMKEAKMRAAGELDNILTVSKFIQHQNDDGRHPEAVGGWDKYQTTFKVGERYYSGEVAIKNTARGRLLYDVTKIEDITESPGLNTGKASTALSISDAFENSILNSSEKINYKAPRGVDPIEWGRRTRAAGLARTELERSAAIYRVDPQVAESIARLARDTGARVVFDGTLGPNVEGYYAEGYIHLNPLHQNAVARIFTHELTHHLESTGVYGKLERLVLSQLENVEQAAGEKTRECAKSGMTLDEQGARAELVAGYVSEKLFTDEAAVRRVANADLSLAGRIRSFLSRMAAQVTGQKEKAFLLKAESLYAKAIREAGRKNDAAGNRFSVENEKGLWYDGEKGGAEDGGAEIRDAGGRDRGEVPGAGGQSTAGDGYFRGTESSGAKVEQPGKSGKNVRFTDSEGRGIRPEIAERMRW